ALVSVDDVHRAEAAIAAADVVLLQLEIPVETVAAAVQLARRHQVPVIVDPAPARTDLPAEILSADWLCPNETEAEVLSGFSVRTPVDAATAAAALRTTDQTTVVITLGDQGAVCHTGEATLHLEAFPVTPVDTTAAGDAFAAALGIAIAKDCLPAMAVRYAAAAGALAATQPGAQPGMPTADAVDQLLNNHSPSQHLL
ncbi:MAG: PfkB family carbohydrate kinase, partial [Planctomycetaceae bacterium]